MQGTSEVLLVKEEPKSSLKSEKVHELHVTKVPDQQKNQKITTNLLTTQFEKDCKDGLTSKAEKPKDEKSKVKDNQLLTRKCELFRNIVWVLLKEAISIQILSVGQ